MIDLWMSPKDNPIYAIGLKKQSRSNVGLTERSKEEVIEKNKHNALNSYHSFERLVQNNFNPNSSLFITFTFANTDQFDVTDVKQCNRLFTKFFNKVMRPMFGNKFKYVATIEFQDANNRGAVHYHVLIDLMKPYPYIDKKKLAKLWGYGSNVEVERLTSSEHVARYVGMYMYKQIIDERLYGKKKYWSSQGLVRPNEMYGTNVEKLLEFLDTIPEEQIKKYSKSVYLSEYHGCEVEYSRLFIPKELMKKFNDSIKGRQTA